MRGPTALQVHFPTIAAATSQGWISWSPGRVGGRGIPFRDQWSALNIMLVLTNPRTLNRTLNRTLILTQAYSRTLTQTHTRTLTLTKTLNNTDSRTLDINKHQNSDSDKDAVTDQERH